MMSLWDALRMNMMISYQELVRTFLSSTGRFEAVTRGFTSHTATSIKMLTLSPPIAFIANNTKSIFRSTFYRINTADFCAGDFNSTAIIIFGHNVIPPVSSGVIMTEIIYWLIT
jgi:hypothetical protein